MPFFFNKIKYIQAQETCRVTPLWWSRCVFGKITSIGKNRGRLIDLDEDAKALVTVHPSCLLPLPDPKSKER